MAMDVGGAKGGVKSDINVTPLVDVMLVLLIIMMIVAPMLQQGVQLTLPTAMNTTDKPDTADQTVVFVDARGQLYINQIPYRDEDVAGILQQRLETVTDRTVYLKGDRDAPYGKIMAMMDALREVGIDQVALITERPGGAQEGGN